MAEQSGETMLEILDKALDDYRRRRFFENLNAGYAALKADPAAWAAMQEERKVWEATLMDSLDSGERWGEDGRCIVPNEKRRTRHKHPRGENRIGRSIPGRNLAD
jgi:hypothetical protein